MNAKKFVALLLESNLHISAVLIAMTLVGAFTGELVSEGWGKVFGAFTFGGGAIAVLQNKTVEFINQLILQGKENENRNLKIHNPHRYELLKITGFLFSTRTQKDTFEQIMADWDVEVYEALFKKEIWKARWINVRYTYAFIAAMSQKSPIGDLIEFIRKIAK